MGLRTLVVGCGHMGSSHARAYHCMPDFEIVGLVSRGATSRRRLNGELGGRYPEFSHFHDALAQTEPDAVCISTYTETHAEYATAALAAGAHVFLEKPVAENNEACAQVIAAARDARRALVVGYILQVHPAWQRFTDIARGLGRPLVMRMNLNQQSAGAVWDTHRQLLRSTSPIVDCGVHYVDVMCRMTGASPVRVNGVAARLSNEIVAWQTNYGHLQVVFDDGSVGWYEAGWGPMMSETAFFVKDVIGPRGAVSIVAERAADRGRSADIDAHTMTEALRVHHAELRPDGTFARTDDVIPVEDEPSHDELCRREQQVFLDAINGRVDLESHWTSAADSLRIVLAADQSAREGRTVEL
ncbi:MAG TPA: Gfo/Idh/MocA family oxidoreductase [Vicinamibacterales bacterium]|nr:Gfo/Idh/MocA family oxidoreductase [Vicinamibacterales bacterium]